LSITRKIKRALRGEVSARAASLEAGRRVGVALRRRRERAMLGKLVDENSTRSPARAPHAARLAPDFARLSGDELLAHFRTRETPRFFAGFDEATRESVAELAGESVEPRARESVAALTDASVAAIAEEGVAALVAEAREVCAHRWPLLGFGTFEFGAEVDWLREPVSGARWPLRFHGDVPLVRGDGSDVRVLWELNRLGHLLTLARACAVAGDENFAEEFFAQVEGWRAQNPAGFGPNWACAMEVALRAMNLVACFQLLRRSRALDERRLASMLALFEEHGRHVRRNLEFSYIATGNHYLSDVAGLFWLGLMLPELRASAAWRDFGLRELLREMDKQVLPDGADCEASTGYHRFAAEIFLYSFILCRANSIRVEERHLRRLRSMLEYTRAYLRPDGRAPLVGDADGGRALPLALRAADEHAYVLGVGAAFFDEPRFKTESEAPEELFWLLGAEGVQTYERLETPGARAATSPLCTPTSPLCAPTSPLCAATSALFEHAGACVLREGDLYLLLNASGAGLAGRGAHGHNDALSIEVSARGVSFIGDPGTYVYTADPRARQLFRSTAYHSTVVVDGAEQNTTDEETPFQIGDEARPRVITWETSDARDLAVAEHYGYERLTAGAITHRRAVTFDKREGFWLIEDTLRGSGEHDFKFVFHAAPLREVRLIDDSTAEIGDAATGARLLVASLDTRGAFALEPRWSSRDYGSKVETVAACRTLRARAPLKARWLLAPVGAGEDVAARLELIARLRKDGLPSSADS
jgi:Heparinase II/III-like protein/Heparinase II/III N-terminus